MKRVLIACLASLVLAGIASAQEIKFSIGEWAPYTGKKISHNGMATEIVTAACQAVGLKPVFGFVPWRRAEAYVINGSVFATFPYTDIAERQGKFLFSNTIFESNFGVLVHVSNPRTKTFNFVSIDSFKGFVVGYTSGTDAVRLPLERAGAKTQETPNLDPSINKLELNRVDFVIDDQAVIFDSLKRQYTGSALAAFKFLDKPFGERTSFKLMASLKYPDSANLIRKFNDGLAKIQANGTYDKILAAYGMKK